MTEPSRATEAVIRAADVEPARKRLWSHLPFLCGVILMALLAGRPLLTFRLIGGHDHLEYLPRNVEFYLGLQAGQVLPRWAPDLSGGYGEPLFNFNPPVFYYVSALFHVLGATFVASEDLAAFALLLLSGVGMYVLANEFFGPFGGLVSATAYVFAPYLLVNLYVRHAFADFSAFAFMPLTFWGVCRFAEDGHYRFLLVGSLSLALLFLSSNPVALICLPALTLLLVWLAWTKRNASILLTGSWCIALGLGLSAFFWLPAFMERQSVHIHRLLEDVLNYHNHFVYLSQLVNSPWGYGLSTPGPEDGMSFAIGPVHLALTGASLLLLWRIRAASRRAALMVAYCLTLFLAAAFFSITESEFIWDHLSLLQYLQFPWRFHSLVAMSTAFLCGFPFLLLAPGRNWRTGGLLVLIAGLLAFNLPHAMPERFMDFTDADFSPQKIVADYVSVTTAREYEPIWVKERPKKPAREPLTFLLGQGNVLTSRVSPTVREFKVEITEEAHMRLNTFYFPGWTVYVDGNQRRVEYDNPQGTIEFNLERGVHEVKAVFADTPIRQWGMRLSVVMVLLLLLSRWFTSRRSVAPT